MLEIARRCVRWMDWYSWMLTLIQWLYVRVSFLVRSLSECITVQRLAVFDQICTLQVFIIIIIIIDWKHLIPHPFISRTVVCVTSHMWLLPGQADTQVFEGTVSKLQTVMKYWTKSVFDVRIGRSYNFTFKCAVIIHYFL